MAKKTKTGKFELTCTENHLHIEFYGRDGQPLRFDLEEFTDTAIERVEREVEKLARNLGGRLVRDPRTDFPSFTVYDENGEEVGGG